MPIGRLGPSRRHKKHPDYRSSRQIKLPSQSVEAPAPTGFASLTAQSIYNATSQALLVTVTGKKRPDNLGPGIFERLSYDGWHRRDIGSGAARRKVEQILSEYLNRLSAGNLLPKKLWIEDCAPEGSDVSAFIQRSCSRCRCPYCDLAQD